MKKNGRWLFILMIMVMSTFKNLKVNIFEIPLVVIIMFTIIFISLLMTVLIKFNLIISNTPVALYVGIYHEFTHKVKSTI
jgi:hypothetical protein